MRFYCATQKSSSRSTLGCFLAFPSKRGRSTASGIAHVDACGPAEIALLLSFGWEGESIRGGDGTWGGVFDGRSAFAGTVVFGVAFGWRCWGCPPCPAADSTTVVPQGSSFFSCRITTKCKIQSCMELVIKWIQLREIYLEREENMMIKNRGFGYWGPFAIRLYWRGRVSICSSALCSFIFQRFCALLDLLVSTYQVLPFIWEVHSLFIYCFEDIPLAEASGKAFAWLMALSRFVFYLERCATCQKGRAWR